MNFNTGMLMEILYGNIDSTLTNAEIQYGEAAEKEWEALILEDYHVETLDEVKNDYVLSFVSTLKDAQDHYFSWAEQIKEDKNITHEEGDTLLIHVTDDDVLRGSDEYYFVNTSKSTVDEKGNTVVGYLKVYGSYYEDCFDYVGKITISNDIPFDSNTVYYKEDSFVNTSVQNVYGVIRYIINIFLIMKKVTR